MEIEKTCKWVNLCMTGSGTILGNVYNYESTYMYAYLKHIMLNSDHTLTVYKDDWHEQTNDITVKEIHVVYLF